MAECYYDGYYDQDHLAEKLADENAKLKAKLAESVALLRRTEWAYGDDDYWCPICNACKGLDLHSSDCELAKFLSENQ